MSIRNNSLICGLAALVVLMIASMAEAALIDEYPSTDEMYAEIRALAESDPAHVELIEYGKSVQGRPLLALRFHLGDGVDRPGGMVAGNIHGEEFIGNRAAMAVADRIAMGIASNDPWILGVLSRMDLYVAPCINPDGYHATVESRGATDFGRMRKNANGVDLNRNFPPPEGRGEMDRSNPEASIYPGVGPLSEPETKGIVDLVLERDVIATVDYHSVAGVFGTPTCYSLACVARYEKMCWAHSKNQRPIHYAWMVLLPELNGEERFPGQMEPYLYHHHGVMAILIELGNPYVNQIQNRSTKTFETFNPKNQQLWAGNEAEAAIHALDAAYKATGGQRVPPGAR